eukprot:g1342.t1
MASLADVMAAAQREQDDLNAQRAAFDERAAAKEAELVEREAAILVRMEKLTHTNNQVKGMVKINVGGTVFTTSMTTLESAPDNLLATTVRHGETLAGGKDNGAFFFDRNPAVFGHVLEWLRATACGTSFVPPESHRDIQLLIIEAGYYLLPSLVAYLEGFLPVADAGESKTQDDAITPKRFQYLKEKGNGRFADCCFTGDFQSRDFSNMPMQNACFVDANLLNATFHGAQLQGARFVRANLRNAEFKGAQLQGATFDNCAVHDNKLLLGALIVSGHTHEQCLSYGFQDSMIHSLIHSFKKVRTDIHALKCSQNGNQPQQMPIALFEEAIDSGVLVQITAPAQTQNGADVVVRCGDRCTTGIVTQLGQQAQGGGYGFTIYANPGGMYAFLNITDQGRASGFTFEAHGSAYRFV